MGYDTIVINNFISTFNGKGYLYSVENQEIFNLNYASYLKTTIESTEDSFFFKIEIFITIMLLYFTTTTLISFAHRELHTRVISFSRTYF